MNSLYRLLSSRNSSRAEGAGDAGLVAAPSADDVLHRFDRSLREVRAYDPRVQREAAAEDAVASEVESALGALRRDPSARLSVGQRLGLETVVRADGTRPSLLIAGGSADPKHPMAASWLQELASTHAEVERMAGATARVQPRGGSSRKFFGSGFLISSQPARLVTNYHVAYDGLRRAIATAEPAPHPLLTSYQIHGGTLEVDFLGEHGALESNTHAVKRVVLPPWPTIGKLPSMDIAILELDEAPLGTLPKPLKLLPSKSFEMVGTLNSFCTIGFPAPPAQRTGIVDGIDWEYVDRAIFGETYGVKRMAPGMVQRSFAELDEYNAGYTFGHDATTLGGASGSATCAWLNGGTVFGMHFSGTSGVSNRAHGFSSPTTAELLRALQVLPGE